MLDPHTCPYRWTRLRNLRDGYSLPSRNWPRTVGRTNVITHRISPLQFAKNPHILRLDEGRAKMRALISVVWTVVTLATVGLVPSAVAQNCPIGTFPSVNQWGTPTCHPFGGGPPAAVQGTLDSCPPGTHPWTDNWGNRTCKAFNGGQQLYDTSRGCPIGTHPWVDNWGNNVCKRL